MKVLPFQNTKIEPEQSIGEIAKMLRQVGFDDIAQITSNGQWAVRFGHSGLFFHFQVQPEAIKAKLLANIGSRKRQDMSWDKSYKEKIEQQLYDQALRMGWRYLREHVKAICDGIKFGAITPAQGFGGHAVLPGPDGTQITLADHLTQAAKDGKLDSIGFKAVLMLEHKK